MSEYNGFSISTVKRANMMMMMGMKGVELERNMTDRFSDEDIERAFREAYRKVGDFVMPKERR